MLFNTIGGHVSRHEGTCLVAPGVPPGHPAGAQQATEFVNAAGDTVQFCGAFRPGQLVVYLTSGVSEANVTRPVATADDELRAAS